MFLVEILKDEVALTAAHGLGCGVICHLEILSFSFNHIIFSCKYLSLSMIISVVTVLVQRLNVFGVVNYNTRVRIFGREWLAAFLCQQLIVR